MRAFLAEWQRWSVLVLLGLVVLWKGGKSIDSSWLLSGLAAIVLLSFWWVEWLQKGRTKKTIEQEIPLTIWGLTLFIILWTGISYMTSQARNYGLDEVFVTAAYGFLFLWIAREKLRGIHTWETWIPRIVVWATAIACFIGMAVYIFQPVNRFVGTFFDYRFHTDYWPNAWAEFLLVAWPIVLLAVYKQQKHQWRRGTLVLLGIVLGCLFASFSRGALLAFTGQIALLCILGGALIFRDVRYARVVRGYVWPVVVSVLGVFLTGVLIFFVLNAARGHIHDVQSVVEKVTFTAAEGTSSIDERSQFWSQAFALMSTHPFVGWGPYSFRFVQPSMMHDVLATSDHPHNVFLKLGAERGLPVLIGAISLLFLMILHALRSLFFVRKVRTSQSDFQTIMIMAALWGLTLHSLIDFNLQFVAIGLLATMLFALLMEPSQHASAQSFTRWHIAKIFARMEIVLAIVLFFFVFVEGLYLCSSSFGRHTQAVGNTQEALEWFAFSHNELFSRDLLLSRAQLLMKENRFEEALEVLDEYKEQNYHDARVWKLRGMILLRLNEPGPALTAFEHAYTEGRYTDLEITLLYLQTLEKVLGHDEIVAKKIEFDELFTDFADAINANTHFIALSANVEALQSVARELARFYPSDGERYILIAREAAAHAKEERSVYEAKPSGILW